MAGTVNVDKLKNEAFSAIDALFSDDEQPDGAQSAESDSQLSYIKLEEYILALDWECTERDINELLALADSLQKGNPDKHTGALLKILKNILVYLSKSGSNAHPETLNIAAEVVAALKKIESSQDQNYAAREAAAVYTKFKQLKEKIAQYNQKLRKPKNKASTDKQTAHIAEQNERKAEPVESMPQTKQAPAGKKETTDSDTENGLAREINFLRKNIEHLERRQEELETLVRKMFSETGGDTPEPATADSFFKDNTKEDEYTFSEQDIGIGSQQSNTEGSSAENASRPDNQDSGQEKNLENVAYVQVFEIGSSLVALPSEYINNIYKLSSKVRKKISLESTISLKLLSSFFKKLSSNMKGTLRGTSEAELKKITCEIKQPGNVLGSKPQLAVLCACGTSYYLIPVTKMHSSSQFLVTEMINEPNDISGYKVQIETLGNIPVYIPC
ncbi:MAG: hypothetical protein ACQES5_04795 [Thermodesulfobacteriota bacterium]